MAKVKMGLKTLDDAEGWKRGVGAYSNSYLRLDRPDDFQYRGSVNKIGQAPGETNAGFSGPIKQGNSPPRYAVKGGIAPHVPKADYAHSPTGKWAKKPGRAGSQRSGA